MSSERDGVPISPSGDKDDGSGRKHNKRKTKLKRIRTVSPDGQTPRGKRETKEAPPNTQRQGQGRLMEHAISPGAQRGPLAPWAQRPAARRLPNKIAKAQVEDNGSQVRPTVIEIDGVVCHPCLHTTRRVGKEKKTVEDECPTSIAVIQVPIGKPFSKLSDVCGRTLASTTCEGSFAALLLF